MSFSPSLNPMQVFFIFCILCTSIFFGRISLQAADNDPSANTNEQDDKIFTDMFGDLHPAISAEMLHRDMELDRFKWLIAKLHSNDSALRDRVHFISDAMQLTLVPAASRAAAMREGLQSGAIGDQVMMLEAVQHLGRDSSLVLEAVRGVIQRSLAESNGPMGLKVQSIISLLNAYPGDAYFSDLFVGYVTGIMPEDTGRSGRVSFLSSELAPDRIQALCQGIILAGRDEPALHRFLAWECSHSRADIRWLAATTSVAVHWPVTYEDGPRLSGVEDMISGLGPDGSEQLYGGPGFFGNMASVPLWPLRSDADRNPVWWRQRTAIEPSGLALIAGWRALPNIGGIDLSLIEATLQANALLENDFTATSVLVGLWHFHGDLGAATVAAGKALNAKNGGNGVRHVVYQWMAMPHMAKFRSLIVRDVVQSMTEGIGGMPPYTALDGVYLLGLLGPDASLASPFMTKLATPGSKELSGRDKNDIMILRYGALWALRRIGVTADMTPVLIDNIRHSDDMMIATAATIAAGSLGTKGTECVGPLRDRLSLMLTQERFLFQSMSMAHPASHMSEDPADYTTLELEIVRSLGLIGGPQARAALPDIDQLLARIAARGDEFLTPPRKKQERIISDSRQALGAP